MSQMEIHSIPKSEWKQQGSATSKKYNPSNKSTLISEKKRNITRRILLSVASIKDYNVCKVCSIGKSGVFHYYYNAASSAIHFQMENKALRQDVASAIQWNGRNIAVLKTEI